jgi:tetratricopeptide (TPR) repeat protein
MVPAGKCGKETNRHRLRDFRTTWGFGRNRSKNPAVMSIHVFRNPEADAESDFAHAKDLALGNPIGALQLLDKYLAQHPDDADAWFLRANCCYRESLWDDAVDSAQKAVDLRPQDVHKWRFLVQCQAALGSGTRRSDPLIDPPTEGTK